MIRTNDKLNCANYARFLLSVWVFGLVSCSKPTPVEFKNICQKENDYAYVSVEGYLRTGSNVLCSSRDGTRACGLELLERLDGGNKISVYVEEGTGKSQMDPLPKSYGKENLKIRTGNGQVLGPEERVRIIGTARIGTDVANSSYSICYVDVVKIERP